MTTTHHRLHVSLVGLADRDTLTEYDSEHVIILTGDPEAIREIGGALVGRYVSALTPEPAPAKPSIPTPWLPWSPNGEIRYDDPQAALAVSADVYESRAGWRWAAIVTPYVMPEDEETGARVPGVPLVPGTPVHSGTQIDGSESEAKAACEAWIVAAVRLVDGGGK